ncbi:alanyl-tRNA synthetase [Nitrosomonas marina]|uniref:Alanine--tRNA ligase n=1 Tax=Nitrosomonas marina TaxID=917 RepID=A0A1I0EES0_9PROT|nr:alanine--tRNA ligase [Nitrosomonas marina]SET43012.1 alanyl-tRNA synthetase [Nitrosomonas marina]
MRSSEIRQKFLDFFKTHGHTIIASSPLVPANDPTLLFTNAGMVQFKDVFLGQDQRSYTRAASSQRCVRAGGKHNDLENVGYTARHHTFFEMLGNFSFGDYFKRNAIQFAWEFLTDTLKIPQEKLWITVYAEDDEAADIWLNEIGINPARFVRIDTMDNFWQMGDTGPCGPCSEIFYDHGPDVAGGPPGSAEAEGDRYIEIWNLVFMQFNRDSGGELHPLPKPSVDTGMGLERISAVMQQVHSNYDIDLFQDLIKAAARVTNTQNLEDNSLKVIADHIRACAFLITDGVIPGSEGRGYVLRRIIRRAIRHGYRLGQKKPFFYRLVTDLCSVMGEAYPELPAAKERVAGVLQQEEERFAETLEHGMQVLDNAISKKISVLDGETAFRLYDTFGFPLDLTADIARERGISIDNEGFERAMARQREQARAANKFTMNEGLTYSGNQTVFHGYNALQHEGKILAIYKEGTPVDFIEAGDEAVIVLDHTPFYAESGGQVGDSGKLLAGNGTFDVTNTQKIQANVFGHKGVLSSGRVVTGDKVLAEVDSLARVRTTRNHSATHLMHKALREVLGDHVQQKGSLVDHERTRFDFSHNEPLTEQQIRLVEKKVNEEILINTECQARIMAIGEAQKSGAMMLFGEKYGDEVRVLDIGSSRELCGGTHVKRTGDIGLFKIISESGVAAGVRRVEACTGDRALHYVETLEDDRRASAAMLKVPLHQGGAIPLAVHHLQQDKKALEKELSTLKTKLAGSQSNDLVSQAQDIKGVKVLTASLEGANAKSLRETLDRLKDKLETCIIVLATVEAEKIALIAGVSNNLTKQIKAGELVNFVARQVGGKGGGRPDMAQAGGTQPDGLPAALESVNGWIENKL